MHSYPVLPISLFHVLHLPWKLTNLFVLWGKAFPVILLTLRILRVPPPAHHLRFPSVSPNPLPHPTPSDWWRTSPSLLPAGFVISSVLHSGMETSPDLWNPFQCLLLCFWEESTCQDPYPGLGFTLLQFFLRVGNFTLTSPHYVTE